MEYKKIKPKKIYEEVADALLEMIRNGDLKPGDKLSSVQQLSENFQVGRAAIREALTSLRAMGLIEMKQGEGTYVKEFSPSGIAFPLQSAVLMNQDDIFHLLEVRKALEVGAVIAAAEKRTSEDMGNIRISLEEMKQAAGNQELGEKADLAFHFAIAKASGNSLLFSLMHHVSDMMVETMRETRRIALYSSTNTMERLNSEHEAIFQAIADQNPEQARKAMFNHLQNVENILSEYILERKR